MKAEIKGYIITASHESERQENVASLRKLLPSLSIVSAIYPSQTRIPFLASIKTISKIRTNATLLEGEIGCLLSHRKVWQQIVKERAPNDAMYLVLESDSQINSLEIIQHNFDQLSKQFDLIFWGAWEGNMKLFRSSQKQIGSGFKSGIPFIKTVYCTYGYSLNAKAANLLLKRTKKFSYPVDQFKYFNLEESIKIGGVSPELITCLTKTKSYIRPQRNIAKDYLFRLILNMRNTLICFFK